MNYLRTFAQYLCVGVLFGLVGLVYSLLQMSGLTGLVLTIPTLVLVVVGFLAAQKLSSYIDSPETDPKHFRVSIIDAQIFPAVLQNRPVALSTEAQRIRLQAVQLEATNASLAGAWKQHLLGSYTKGTSVSAEFNFDLDVRKFDFIDPQKKTLDEMIKLQRQVLDNPKKSIPSPRMVLTYSPTHG